MSYAPRSRCNVELTRKRAQVTDVRTFTFGADTAVSMHAWVSLLKQQIRNAGPRVRTSVRVASASLLSVPCRSRARRVEQTTKGSATAAPDSLESQRADPTAPASAACVPLPLHRCSWCAAAPHT